MPKRLSNAVIAMCTPGAVINYNDDDEAVLTTSTGRNARSSTSSVMPLRTGTSSGGTSSSGAKGGSRSGDFAMVVLGGVVLGGLGIGVVLF